MDFSFEEISKIIRSPDVNKAHGHDDISIRMIKICDNSLVRPFIGDNSLVRPLSLLFEKSYDNSYFPELWKKSNKENDKRNFENYHPFSNVQFPSKRATLKSKSVWFPSIRFIYKSITLNHTRNFPVF